MEDAWPEHLLAPNHPQRQWRTRSDATWEAIRRDYLAGAAARDLCDRYDVALSTLRLKAREGGWRRADQDDSDLFPADADRWVADRPAETDDDPQVQPGGEAGLDVEEDWADLAQRARFRLRRAIGSGRAAEAASWLRVHDRLRALAAAQAPDPEPADLRKVPPSPPARTPPARRVPDPLDTAMSVARQIGSIARRAAANPDEATMRALDAEVRALEARAASLTADLPAAGDATPLDPLDSLHPVFPAPATPVREPLQPPRRHPVAPDLDPADLDRALAGHPRRPTGTGVSP